MFETGAHDLPRAVWQRSLMALLPVVVSAAILPLLTTPSPVGVDAPAHQFSSGRALRHLRQITRHSHPVGSLAHAEVRQYLFRQLERLGLSPQIQTTIVANSASGWHRGAKIHNILARLPGTRLPGTRPGKAVMLVTHYDCEHNSFGAADAGSGVVTLLETARALRSGPALRNDLILLFTDAEEMGLLGATAFVDQHPWRDQVGLVLNFEARGTGGPSAMFETSRGNGRLVEALGQAAPLVFANSLVSALAKMLPNDTDLTVFRRAGMIGLNFAFADELHQYHTPQDSVQNLEEGSLQHHGLYALSLARHFGSRDLGDLAADDSVYFDVLGRWLISYGPTGSYLLCIAVLALFILTLYAGLRRSRVTLRGVAGGFLTYLLILASVVISVSVLRWAIGLIRPGHLLLVFGKTFTVALLMISLGLCVVIHRWRGARSGAQNIFFGALTLWLGLTVATTLWLPGGSFLFAWPLLFCLIGTLLWIVRIWGRVALFCLASIPCTIMLFSMLYVALILDGGSLPAIPAAFAFMLWIPLIPHVAALGPRIGRRLPAVLVAAGASLLAFGLILFDYSPRNPRPHWINYGLDMDAKRAYWITGEATNDDWIARQIPQSSSRGTLPQFFVKDSPRRYGPARAIDLAAPTITLTRDWSRGPTRSVDLHIRSPRHAPCFTAWEEGGATIRSTIIAGRRLSQVIRFSAETDRKISETLFGRARAAWKLRFCGLDADGLDLHLEVAAGHRLKLRIVDESYGLPLSTPRPPTVMPNSQSDVTLASKLYEL